MLKKSILAVLTLLVLTACGNKDEDLTAKEREKVIEDGTVGFEMMGGEVEKATNVPANEEEAILAAFDEYIAAFNDKDIDRYMNTISKKPKGFNYDEDKILAEQVFDQTDTKRNVENVTIAKYDEEEAQVFANMTTHSLQLETNVEHESAGRQVTVFVKEGREWKVTSVFYIGDDTKSSTGN
ncbi:nuclear transport factor 2 family protein [Lysinibacillus sp. NPDC097279]|uniref:nuclear transport factor 2 family protein n=1 Tax=Lysinibacillus sp. NPDC097279 TaxID=3364143 RepID=UPI0038196363